MKDGEGMKTGTLIEPMIDPSARDFLKQHHAEPDLQTVCDLVRACFPELQALEVRLVEDPDEENHTWVAFHVLMPATHPRDLLRSQERSYHEQHGRVISRPYHPFSFGLAIEFMPG
jgi:hypothetical protein